MQKKLILLVLLTLLPLQAISPTDENTPGPNPILHALKTTLQVSGLVGLLYGLSRWTISEKAGRKELDSWIDSKWKDFKPTEKHQVVFFGGWATKDSYPNPWQANLYLEKVLPFNQDTISREVKIYAPGNKNGRRFNSFAQRWDIYQIEKNLLKIMSLKTNTSKKTLVFAHCNGASALIALLFQKPELADQLAGIVLYAPYADIADYEIISGYLPRCLYHKALVKRCIQASYAPNYSCNAKSPVEWIATGSVRKDLPIILIHSDDDKVVPMNHCDQISTAFCANGYQKFTQITCSNKGHFPMDLYDRTPADVPILTQIRNTIREQMFGFTEILG